MIQPAIDDEEYLSARDLAIEDARHVNAGLADQIAAQLDHQLGFRQFGLRPLDQRRKIRTDRREVEPLLAGEIGNAEATSEVEKTHRRRCVLRQSQREFVGLALGLDDCLGLEVLRTGEQMKTLEGQPGPTDLCQRLRHLLGIDPELLRAAAHLHARRFQFEIRIDTHRHARGEFELLRNAGQKTNLAEGFDIHQDTRRDGLT